MKANAPEKLYVDVHDNLGDHFLYGFTEKRTCDDIEYIRTDAFIEKVLDYIENNIYDHYDGDNEYGICGGYAKKEEFIRNFKNYMKGE